MIPQASPPIAAVFLLGLFWRRLNATGAMASLITVLVLGMGRLVLEVAADDLTGVGRDAGRYDNRSPAGGPVFVAPKNCQ